MYTNTEDTDCEQCKCDLYLSAIISPQCPGKAACPEHASCLPCPPSSWILLYRCAPHRAGCVCLAMKESHCSTTTVQAELL